MMCVKQCNFFAIFLAMVIACRVCGSESIDHDTLQDLRLTLRSVGEQFLAENRIRSTQYDVSNNDTEPGEKRDDLSSENSESDGGERNLSPPSARVKRSGCPGGVGNFGFNSYNLLTFALQVFNGVINTINNMNNNNNNDNINAGNNANSNYNEQNSNVMSMSMLVIVVPPGRRKRDVWESENGGCLLGQTEEESLQAIEKTYSAISNIADTLQEKPECAKYVLCVNIRDSYTKYGLQVLSEMAHQKHLWNSLISPLIDGEDNCDSLFPECQMENGR